MKKLIPLFLVSFSAFAGPKVGDTSVLFGTLQHLGPNVSVKSSITEIDVAADRALYRREWVREGKKVLFADIQSPLAELDADGIDQMLQNCSALGGTRQTISVKAGNFDTCRM